MMITRPPHNLVPVTGIEPISRTNQVRALPLDETGINLFGTPGQTRTDTLLLLRQSPLTIGLQGHVGADH